MSNSTRTKQTLHRVLRRFILLIGIIFLINLMVSEKEKSVPRPFLDYRHGRTEMSKNSPINIIDPVHVEALGADKPGDENLDARSWDDFRKSYRSMTLERQKPETGEDLRSGGRIRIRGALIPLEAPQENGELTRFWIANPNVVMAGCVFCNPPTMGDLILVEIDGSALHIDREQLYRGILIMDVVGTLQIGMQETTDGFAYLFYLKVVN